MALFLTPHEPSVFIEVKALGKLEGVLSQAERQLRDYNRDNQALFSIITDGQTWRFYHSAARGEFANRCFKILNLIEHNLDDLEQGFAVFLSRIAVETGNSEREATTYLQLSRKQRAMEDALPEARRRVLEPPFPKLTEALIQLVAEGGISISMEEAERFIREYGAQRPPQQQPAEPSHLTREQPEVETSQRSRRRSTHDDRIEMTWYDHAILKVLFEMGGRALRNEVHKNIKQMLQTQGKFTPDLERPEPNGAIPWKHRTDARRNDLKDKGYISDRSKRRVWELTEKGQREAAVLCRAKR